MKEGRINLTSRQNMILYCLQNDWSLITGDHKPVCCSSRGQFEFTWGLLMRMVNKGLIMQRLEHPFDYQITDLGRGIATKKIQVDEWM